MFLGCFGSLAGSSSIDKKSCPAESHSIAATMPFYETHRFKFPYQLEDPMRFSVDAILMSGSEVAWKIVEPQQLFRRNVAYIDNNVLGKPAVSNILKYYI